MALPETVRVKLSSEAAESISLTPAVVQQPPLRGLLGPARGAAGEEAPATREILLRGTLVSGASRFRWAGWQVDGEGLREILSSFPDPDPSLPFTTGRCIRVILRGGRQPIEISRDAGEKKSLFQRSTFWDLLME